MSRTPQEKGDFFDALCSSFDNIAKCVRLNAYDDAGQRFFSLARHHAKTLGKTATNLKDLILASVDAAPEEPNYEQQILDAVKTLEAQTVLNTLFNEASTMVRDLRDLMKNAGAESSENEAYFSEFNFEPLKKALDPLKQFLAAAPAKQAGIRVLETGGGGGGGPKKNADTTAAP